MGLDMMLYKHNKNGDSQIGYWRKFNALHNYIGNMKNKPDNNCEKLWLTKADVDELLEMAKTVKDLLDKDPPKTIHKIIDGKVTEIVDEDHKWPKDIEDIVSGILQPKGGFFWGGTEIDYWYYLQVCESIPIFEKAKEAQKNHYRIYYTSWW